MFAVGDDDQSIYAFRGATTSNMGELQKDFAIQTVIKLEQNYRSHGHILDAANALIKHNERRLGKELWTEEAKGEPLRVYEADSDMDEASFIVGEVKSLVDEGVRLSEIALLYRSNAQSRVLEHALFNSAIAYRVYGGLRFFERQEIKHALAYLRLLASDADDSALLRVINFPARGIGNRSLEQLQESAAAAGVSLWAAAKAMADARAPKTAGSAEVIPHPASLKGIPAFVALIIQMRSATASLPLPEIIEHVIEHSGLKQHYQGEREGADRLSNLDELINAAAGFIADDSIEDSSLAGFLAHASLEAGDNQAQAGSDALQLMTVHSAKGLEFHTVFISGLEEGLFPHENSLSEADGKEEERRLMYVALTRARRRLYLSMAQSRMLHGQVRYNIASSFFREIPEPLLKRINRARSFVPQAQSPRQEYGDYARRGAPEIVREAGLADTSSPWRVGQNVTHPKFGAGVIISAEGRGADARVQVNFHRNGSKWLALEYAKLEPA